MFDRLSSIKFLHITKNVVNGKILAVGKLLVISKHLVNTNLFSVGKHLVDTEHLTLMKMLTNLTYLPDLTIYEKLD